MILNPETSRLQEIVRLLAGEQVESPAYVIMQQRPGEMCEKFSSRDDGNK